MKMKRAAVCLAIAAAGFTMLGACAGGTSHHQKLVEDTYTVKSGDTLWTISEAYLKKNTGGRRYILEFKEGIKELNPWLLETDGQVKPGDVLRINYFVKEADE